jgi:hypothetical protein
MRREGLGKLRKIHLIGTPSRDLPACSIVPQPLRYRVSPPILTLSIHKFLCGRFPGFLNIIPQEFIMSHMQTTRTTHLELY